MTPGPRNTWHFESEDITIVYLRSAGGGGLPEVRHRSLRLLDVAEGVDIEPIEGLIGRQGPCEVDGLLKTLGTYESGGMKVREDDFATALHRQVRGDRTVDSARKQRDDLARRAGG